MKPSTRTTLLDDWWLAISQDPRVFACFLIIIVLSWFALPILIWGLITAILLNKHVRGWFLSALLGLFMGLGAWWTFNIDMQTLDTCNVLTWQAIIQGNVVAQQTLFISLLTLPYGLILGAGFAALLFGRTGLQREIRRVSQGKTKAREKPLSHNKLTHRLKKLTTAAVPGGSVLGVTRQYGKCSILWDKDANLHTLAIGTTGTGKTTAVGNLIESTIDRNLPLIYVDGKGDLDLAQRIETYAQAQRKTFYLFSMVGPSVRYNPLASGGITSKKDRIIELREWSEDHYRKLAEGYVQTVFQLLKDADLSIDLVQLAKYLEPETLFMLARERQHADWFERIERLESRRKDIESVVAEIQNFAESEIGPLFDCQCDGSRILTLDAALKENAVVYFCLQPLAYPSYANTLGKLIINDLKVLAASQLHGGAKIPLYVIFDEFSVFAGEQIINLINQGRSAGIHAVLATQSLADLSQAGGQGFLGQILNNTNNYLVMRQNNPDDAEVLANVIGTQEGLQVTSQVSTEPGQKPAGSVRSTREFFVHPDEIKRLGLGEALLVNKQRFAWQAIQVRQGVI